MNERVVVYLRYSGGDEQRNKDVSCAQQEKAIRAYCAEHGIEIAHVYQDAGISGTNAEKREQFQAMIRDLGERRFPHVRGVIVWSLSRFARNLDDAAYYKARIRKLGYTITSITEPVEDNSMGRVIEFLNDWQNAEYSKKISADVKRALRSDFEIYKVIPGHPPFGFKRVPVELPPKRDGTKRIRHRWLPDEETAPIARAMFEARASGMQNAEILRRYPVYKNVVSLGEMFTRTIYIGIMTFSDVTDEAYCPAIVPPSVWYEVQNIMKHDTQRGKTRQRNPGLLSGLVKCAHCGANMTVSRSRTKGILYVRYRCEHCTGVSVRADKLEDAVIDTIRESILTPDNLIRLLNEHNTRISHADERRRAALDEAYHLQARIDRLTDLIAETGNRALVDKLEALEQKRDEAYTCAEQTRPQSATISERDMLRLVSTARNVAEALINPDEPARRDIVHAVILSITYTKDGDAEIAYTMPNTPKSWAHSLVPPGVMKLFAQLTDAHCLALDRERINGAFFTNRKRAPRRLNREKV